MAAAGDTAAPGAKKRSLFRRHFAAFLIVNIGLTATNVAMGAPWWAIWPLLVWGVPLVIHYLYYKASAINDDWVDARMEDLRSKSYDLSHIDDIKRKPAAGAAPTQEKPPTT